MTDRIHVVTMPKWGMTMTEGKVAAWLKAEGERIEAGDDFVEVETDKITNVVEAQASGLLRRVLVAEGQTAPVGAPIALLAEVDVTDAELDAVASTAAVTDSAEGGLRETRVPSGDLQLHVAPAGSGEGVPLVLLHGFADSSKGWMFVHDALTQHRPVRAIDLPSHRQSDVAPGLATLDQFADALVPVINAVAPGPLHLAGHSLGGRLALRLAAFLGDRVTSLALIAPAGLGGESTADFPAAFLAADQRRPTKEALRMLVASEDLVTTDMVEGALASKRIDGAQAAYETIAGAALGDNAREGADADLAAVQAPILTIWGADDQVVPAPSAGDHQLVPDAGHIPQMEAPAKVAALLIAHMEASE